jgi:hypothetical protein
MFEVELGVVEVLRGAVDVVVEVEVELQYKSKIVLAGRLHFLST